MAIENPQLNSPLNLSSKDKFVLIMDLPHALRKLRGTNPVFSIDKLHLSIFGTVVPDISVPETDVKFQGQNLHLSTYARPSYPPLDVTFVVDNGYKNYFLLWKWLNFLNSATENMYGGSKLKNIQDIVETGDQFEYQTTINVFALDEYNKPSLQFTYLKAFITKLGGLQYSYKESGNIESSVSFHYSQLDVTNELNMGQL